MMAFKSPIPSRSLFATIQGHETYLILALIFRNSRQVYLWRDYRMDTLNPRNFEHITQSLLKSVVAPGVRPFGDGPDGARPEKTTYEGKMDYPSNTDAWHGYLVVQCKFRQRLQGTF